MIGILLSVVAIGVFLVFLFGFRSGVQLPAGVLPITSLWRPPLLKMMTSVFKLQEFLLDEYMRLPETSRPPMFRLSVGFYHALVAVEPQVTKQILADTQHFDKDTSFIVTPLRLLTEKGIVLVSGDQWKRQRKIMDPTLTPSVLRRMTPLIQGKLQGIVDEWQKLVVDGKVDISALDWAARASIDVLGKIAFSHDFDAAQGKNDNFLRKYHIVADAALNPLNAPLMAREGFPLPRNREVWQAVRELEELANGIAEKKLEKLAPAEAEIATSQAAGAAQSNEEDELSGDMVDMLIQSHQLDLEELRGNIFTLLIAGYETTSTTMSLCLGAFARHQKEQEKVRQEMERVLGDANKITLDLLNKLEVMERFVKEVLRMEPPVGLVPTRKCTEDVIIDGVQIPRGVRLSVPLSVEHMADTRLPEYFENASEFNPDRWILSDPANKEAGLRAISGYLAFSHGPRFCIGTKLGLIEIKMFLCLTLRHFKITEMLEFEPGTSPVFRGASKLNVRMVPV